MKLVFKTGCEKHVFKKIIPLLKAKDLLGEGAQKMKFEIFFIFVFSDCIFSFRSALIWETRFEHIQKAMLKN